MLFCWLLCGLEVINSHCRLRNVRLSTATIWQKESFLLSWASDSHWVDTEKYIWQLWYETYLTWLALYIYKYVYVLHGYVCLYKYVYTVFKPWRTDVNCPLSETMMISSLLCLKSLPRCLWQNMWIHIVWIPKGLHR